MAIEIKMPRLSDTMESGTLVKWHVKEGDSVKAGQVLADVETDKATMEMPVYDAGVVAKILTAAGSKVGVGQLMMVLADPSEKLADVAAKYAVGGAASSAPAAAPAQKTAAASAGAAPVVNTSAPVTVMDPPHTNGHSDAGRMIVSPLAKRLAEDMGVNLRSVHGSGPGGRIVKRDILQAAQSGSSAASAPATGGIASARVATASSPSGRPAAFGTTVPLTSMRQTIARRLVESKSTIPHYQVSCVIDMDPLVALRETINTQLAAQNVKLSVNDFIVRACALSIHQHPMFNASWAGESIRIADRVNVGVAISLPEERGGGLVVGTIYDADLLGLRQISAETRRLAEKARTQGLKSEEITGSTFTLSNLGMYGVEHFTAIINPPNAAILAVGATVKRPVVRQDQIVIGHEMTVTLSNDHRIIDGAMAARFLQTLKAMLEAPAGLLV